MTTPQKRGLLYESEIAKKVAGRTVALSGAGLRKGDVETERFLVQCKRPYQNSSQHLIRKAELDKIEKEATDIGKYWAYVFQSDRRDYVVLPLEWLEYLQQVIRDA